MGGPGWGRRAGGGGGGGAIVMFDGGDRDGGAIVMSDGGGGVVCHFIIDADSSFGGGGAAGGAGLRVTGALAPPAALPRTATALNLGCGWILFNATITSLSEFKCHYFYRVAAIKRHLNTLYNFFFFFT